MLAAACLVMVPRPLPRPSLKLLWTRQDSVRFEDGGDFSGNKIASDASGEYAFSGERAIRLRDGVLCDRPQAPPNELPPILGQGLTQHDLRTMDGWRVLWRTDKTVIAMRKSAKDSYELGQFLPGQKPSIETVPIFPDEGVHVSWYTRSGVLLVGQSSQYTGRTTIHELIYKLPMTMAYLEIDRVWDVSPITRRVLGVFMPENPNMNPDGVAPSRPDGPLACVDPGTGDTLWIRTDHDLGAYWLDRNYVLAADPWAIINGNTGDEVPSNARRILKGTPFSAVHVVGKYVIVQDRNANPVVTKCFQFVAPATR